MNGPVWRFPQNQAASSLSRQLSRDFNQRRARGELPATIIPAAPVPTRHRVCQWPLWANDAAVPKPPLFCGDPVVPELSYCSTHCARAYVVREPE